VLWNLPIPVRASSQQGEEFIHGQTSVCDDAAEGAESNRFVVGDDGTTVRRVATKDHVTAALPAEHETRSLQRGTHLPAR
jgi:hypothetical protein